MRKSEKKCMHINHRVIDSFGKEEKNLKKGKWCFTSNTEKFNQLKYLNISWSFFLFPSISMECFAENRSAVSLSKRKLIYQIKKNTKVEISTQIHKGNSMGIIY